MDRKDWLVPLLAAVIGVMGTLAGSLVAGYQHERAAARQAQFELAKQLAAERAAEFQALKEAGLSYMRSTYRCVGQQLGVCPCTRQSFRGVFLSSAKRVQRCGAERRRGTHPSNHGPESNLDPIACAQHQTYGGAFG